MKINNEKKKPSAIAIKAIIFTILVVTVGSIYRTSKEENISPNDCYVVSGQYSEILPLIGNATGPESYAFDPNGGGPYTGVSDGRILKWEEHQRRWIDFATTSPDREGCEGPQDHHKREHICGRPMGMGFNKATGDLYIADAYMGLVKVGPHGGLASQVATKADNITFGFPNGLDIDQSTGVVYFTDSSSRFQRRKYIGSLLTNDKSGRLMKYDPKSNQVTVLLQNLSMPNGVSISTDGNYLLLAESATYMVLKYWIKTSKAGTIETFTQLLGFVDNIKRSSRGGFWVAIISQKSKLTEWFFSPNSIGNAIVTSVPIDYIVKLQSYIMKIHNARSKYVGNHGMVVRLNEDGEIVETFVDKSGSTSEVFERDEFLWIGNVNKLYARRFKL